MEQEQNIDKNLSTEDEIKKLLEKITPGYFVVTKEGEIKADPEGFIRGIMARYTFKTLVDIKEMLWYKNGVYKHHGENIIEAEVENIWKNAVHKPATKHFVSEIIEAIKRRTFVERLEINPPGYVNVKNGILNLEALELEPHTPEKVFTIQLPVAYNPQAQCPKIDRFLQEVCPDGVQTIEELIGWCLEDGYDYQRSVLLYGSGNNGKSTFLNLVRTFLGPENVSSRLLQDLVTNRFALADLYGKLANICADLPNIALTNTGIYKMLTGGDPITAERKFGHPFQFVNRAKLIFSTNQLFGVDDPTNAFWRRWILLQFPNDFTGREINQTELWKD